MVQIRRIAIAIGIAMVAATTVAGVEIGTYRQLIDVLRYGGPGLDPPVELADLPVVIRSEEYSFGRWVPRTHTRREYQYEFDGRGRVSQIVRTSVENGIVVTSAFDYACSDEAPVSVTGHTVRPGDETTEFGWSFSKTPDAYVERLFRSGSLSTEWIYELDEYGRPTAVAENRFWDGRLLTRSSASYQLTYAHPSEFRVESLTRINQDEVSWRREFSYISENQISVQVEFSYGEIQLLTYDNAGRLVELTETRDGLEIVYQYEYDSSGRLIYEYYTETEPGRGSTRRRTVYEYAPSTDA